MFSDLAISSFLDGGLVLFFASLLFGALRWVDLGIRYQYGLWSRNDPIQSINGPVGCALGTGGGDGLWWRRRTIKAFGIVTSDFGFSQLLSAHFVICHRIKKKKETCA